MRKTKIVCTIGPASESVTVLKELMKAGMNVARINFSHGGIEEQLDKINNVKQAREELGKPIALMLDTKGPEIRTGKLDSAPVELRTGGKFVLTTKDIVGSRTRVSITYKKLYKEVKVKNTILLDDGKIELKVEKIENEEIHCKVVHGGYLGNRKGVNVPNVKVNIPNLTEKDIEDIKAGAQHGFDYIAASFIRKAEDVQDIRALLKENGGEKIKIISKIENREGIDNFDSILRASDGIMIARGDLSVEVPMEEVPILQKQFIKKCYMAGKPVITATQMLESMIVNTRPTRAEVSDVANSVFDLTGAIMLSAETALGDNPLECVQTMDTIATTVENSIHYWSRFNDREYSNCSYEVNMNRSICTTAMNMDAKAIFAYTHTGDTPRVIAGFSPNCPIYAVTANPKTFNQLSLVWGIDVMLVDKEKSIDEMIKISIDSKKDEGTITKGDYVVIAGGGNVFEGDENKPTSRMIGGVIKI